MKDPIFQHIADYRTAVAVWLAIPVRTIEDENTAAYKRALKAVRRAENAIFTTRPTTLAGLIAQTTTFIDIYGDRENPHSKPRFGEGERLDTFIARLPSVLQALRSEKRRTSVPPRVRVVQMRKAA